MISIKEAALKYKYEMIAKKAQEAQVQPAAPEITLEKTDTAKAPAKQPSTTSSPSSFYTPQFSHQNIITLQQALIDLSKSFSKPIPTGPHHTNPTKESPFLSFVVNTLGNTTMQRTDAPTGDRLKQTDTDKTPVEVLNLQDFLKSFSIIGKHNTKQETIPDGNWGTYTQKAIENAYELFKMLAGIVKTLGVKDLSPIVESMKQKIPTDVKKQTQDQLDTLAPTITEFINYIKVLYSTFEKVVLENPKYKDYINQDKAFESKITPSKITSTKEILKDFDPTTTKITIPKNLHDMNSDKIEIYLDSLTTKDKFIKMLDDNKIVFVARDKKEYPASKYLDAALDAIKQYLTFVNKSKQPAKTTAVK